MAACGRSRGGAGWAGMAQLIVLLVHASIVCPCSQQLHSPFIAKPHYLFDLGECNTVSGAGVEGEAVVIDQHGDHDV